MSEPNSTPAAPNISPAPKRRRWLMWLLLVAVFLSGFVCGAGLTLAHVVRQARTAAVDPEFRVQRGARWLARRLDLAPAQQAAVRDILRAQSRELSQVRQDVWPQVTARLKRTESEIAGLLTPQQREKWRDVAAQLRKQWLPPAAQDSFAPPGEGRPGERPGQSMPVPGAPAKPPE